jgi:peptide chain release factor subunit 1
LQTKILKLVDVSYGGENGFNQAIELSAEILSNVKFIQEKKLIGTCCFCYSSKPSRASMLTVFVHFGFCSGRYFDEISQETSKYCFGVEETLKALEMGAVEILIAWENMDNNRWVLKNPNSGEEKVLHLNSQQEKEKTHLVDKDTGVELELVECMPLLEWLANNYKNFGATLEIITDRSQEGSQFVKGFGGIGGILRYRVDFQQIDELNYETDDFDFDDL